MITSNDFVDRPLHNVHDNSSASELLSSQFLNRFTHTFGHDLRSPLFVIRSYGYLLQKTQEKEKLERGFKSIEEASYKIERLLNDFIKLIDTYTLPTPKYREISFLKAYQKALLQVEYLIKDSDVNLQHNFSDIPFILFDEKQLIQIMVALLENAIRHNSDQSDLKISIETKAVNNQTILSITDNGKGFDSSEDISKLVLPFASLSNDITCTGMGLALVQAIARVSDNQFTIKSTGNGFTSCRFTFL